MRILVTGAAGFLGRALLRTLASRAPDDQIAALDLAPLVRMPTRAGQISWLSGALDDRDMMERARLQDFDVVYHLASVPGALAEREPALGRRVNLDATLDLFDRLAALRPKAAGCLREQRRGLWRHGRTTDRRGQSDAADKHLRRPQADGRNRALGSFPEGRAFRNCAAPSGPHRAPGKTAGFGSAFMSELPRAYAAGRALRLPRLASRPPHGGCRPAAPREICSRPPRSMFAARFSFRPFDCRSPRSSMRFPISSGRIAGRSFRSIQTSASKRCLAAFPNSRPRRKRPSASPTTERRSELIKEALAP